jgi:hypothetical protein
MLFFYKKQKVCVTSVCRAVVHVTLYTNLQLDLPCQGYYFELLVLLVQFYQTLFFLSLPLTALRAKHALIFESID